MYMQAMVLVRMGDSSVAAYEHLISLFKKCAVEMKPFTDVRDGLGLENRLADNNKDMNGIQSGGDICREIEGTHITMGDGDCIRVWKYASKVIASD